MLCELDALKVLVAWLLPFCFSLYIICFLVQVQKKSMFFNEFMKNLLLGH